MNRKSASELQEVFQNLPTYLITKHEIMEISVAFTAIGALLAAIAVTLSLRWHPLPSGRRSWEGESPGF